MRDRDRDLSPPDLQPMSLVETQDWVRSKEFKIHLKLQRQIEDESFDSLVEAGNSGFMG